ncbi:S8 family serine peptidase [Haladaptatus sp. T7]|uniref:S8 family peptidase n=1 Tax=Haladaptatus sp. T7 TaxID=2029368 RepID=UPI0021A25A01|nr:S8 family serine peptidase [Haladaptatus sp. T7]GKZ12548.1 serine protease [Haladaptatus sp. T7]
MSRKPTRRSFLKGAGAALGGLTLTMPTVSAESREDRYVVDLRDAPSDVLDGLEVVHHLDQIDIAVVKAEKSDVSGTRYSKDVEMELNQAETEHHEHPDHHPHDTRYDLQWDKQAQDVLQVHRMTRGEGTRVSVIDSGALETHPDLQHALNTDLSKNFTGDGGDFNPILSDHGTHCSGIIAADGSNEDGVIGTAPDTDLVALRVFTGPFATFGDIVAAMVYSADIESDVANMSLGAYPLPNDSDTALLQETIERASGYANENGTLLVAAAGNDSANLDADGDVISLPNEADNVMSISATGPIGFLWDDEQRKEKHEEKRGHGGWHHDRHHYKRALHHLRKPTYEPAFYTNYGAEAIDISAPGGNFDQDAPEDANAQYDLVLSTVFEWGDEDDDADMVPAYGWKGGTSMASPQVAAVAALVKSVNPDATPGEVREHLEATARDLGDPTYHGEGHLDTKHAVWRRIRDHDHGHGHGGHGHDHGHDHGHGHDDDDHDGDHGHGHDD